MFYNYIILSSLPLSILNRLQGHISGYIPKGWINDERMAIHCLESGCIGLYIPPLGSVRKKYQVDGGGGGEVVEVAFTTFLTEAAGGQNETVSSTTFGHLNTVVLVVHVDLWIVKYIYL